MYKTKSVKLIERQSNDGKMTHNRYMDTTDSEPHIGKKKSHDVHGIFQHKTAPSMILKSVLLTNFF